MILRMRRVLNVSRGPVFEACTDAGELAKWWGPKGFTAPRVDIDLRPGGRYRIAMQPPNGDLFYLSGEFQEIEDPFLLVYTFQWEDPDIEDVETIVLVLFREVDGATELSLVQGVFATQRRLALHAAGWGDALDRLEALLSAGSSGVVGNG